jgi:hypothetical protein
MDGSYDIDINKIFGFSKRSIDFFVFVHTKVIPHIEDYTVPQYGDKPNDNVESWTAEMCFKTCEKYFKRHGNNQREGQDILDAIKMVHWLQLYVMKREEEDSIKSEQGIF